MKKAITTILKIVLPLGIGVYLTWYFISRLSDTELENLENAFFQADYSYMFFGLILLLLSHMSRAYRWKYMLQPLGYHPTFWKMYHSVMIGYLINLTIPRSGEVARAGYYAKYEKGASFNKVFGTIIVERVVDLLMLGIVMLTTVYLQKDVEAFHAIKDSGKSGSSFPQWIYFVVGGVVIAGIVVVFLVEKIKQKIKELFKGIFEGIKTIIQLKQRVPYILHTLFIWACYLGMIWVCSFTLPETSNLSIAAVFAAFTVGGIAISATPGGLGLYPFMVGEVLGVLYGIENPGSFSMLAWSFLTAFTILLGLVSLFVLPFIGGKPNPKIEKEIHEQTC
ncbi:MAG: flippase-like domain-containing protein [Flavobacteriales bacterium]|nr:flippase-like domain-containing protein [Flavobacteriales bacterium]